MTGTGVDFRILKLGSGLRTVVWMRGILWFKCMTVVPKMQVSGEILPKFEIG